jgi:hypothetical protein
MLLLCCCECHLQLTRCPLLCGNMFIQHHLPNCHTVELLCLTRPCNTALLLLLPTLQTGYPLQYNQYPLLRAVWNFRFIAHVLVHKLLPFMISPPLFLMIQDPSRRYSSVLQDNERSKKLLAGLGVLLVAAVAVLLQKLLPRLLKVFATGSA